jgi:hypothetical protein
MTRAALRRKLAAVLPVLAIVALLGGLFAIAWPDAAPPRVAGGAVPTPPASLAADASGRDAMRPARTTRIDAGTGRAEVRACGGAWLPLDANGVADETAALELADRETDAVEAAVRARLVASGDPRDTATVLRLRTLASRFRPADPGVPDADGRQAHAALVALAATSRDPEVYGAAYESCDAAAVPSTVAEVLPAGCALLSAAQWAALAPDNAIAWLARADEARRAGEAAAERDALWRAAQAPRAVSSFGSFVGRVAAQVPDGDASLWGAYGVVVKTFGLAATQRPASASVLRGSCGSTAVQDPERRELCDGVATQLVARSDTLLDRQMGVGLGRRLGWAEDRLARLKDELNEFGARFADEAIGRDPEDCGPLRRSLRRARDMAEHGEIGALRRAEASATTLAGPVPLR